MKALLSYSMAALLIGALGFASGVWWSKETKPAVPAVAAVEREHVELQTPTEPAPQVMCTDFPTLQFNDIPSLPSIFEQLHLTYEIAGQSDLDQLVQYLEQSYDRPDPLFNHNITSILLERMIAIDPNEALAFVHEHPAMNQYTFISHVLTSWIRHDPEPAIDYFKSLTDQRLRVQIGTRILSDPALSDSVYLSEIEEALGSQAQRIGEQIRLRRLSPQDAFEDATLRTDRQRTSRMMQAISRWYQRDPDAALGRLSGLSNQRERQQLMSAIISMQVRMDPEKALEMLDTYAPDDRNLQQQVLTRIGMRNPEVALPRIEALISETGNPDILGNLLSQWIRVDEGAALAYMADMPEQYEEHVFQRISHSYISQSPEEGMTWLMSLDEKYDRSVKSSAMSVLSQFPDMAESWLYRLADKPVLHGALLRSMAQHRAQEDPREALEWLEQYTDSSSYESSRRSVIQNWAHQDPRGVASLLEDNAADPSYQHLFQMTSQRWMTADPSSAHDWIESLPPSPGKVNAVSGAISNMSDPEEAIVLLEDLPSESIASVTMQLASSWLRREPDEIERIIARLDLTEQQAANLRRQMLRE